MLVHEDAYIRDNNNNKTAAIITEDDDWKAPTAGDKVIVGIISIKLELKSPRKG